MPILLDDNLKDLLRTCTSEALEIAIEDEEWDRAASRLAELKLLSTTSDDAVLEGDLLDAAVYYRLVDEDELDE